jgi:sugar lactone lactonase YvrE
MGSNRGDGEQPRLARRVVLKSLAAGAVLWEPACAAPPSETPALGSQGIAPASALEAPIRIENRLPGTSDFELRRPAQDGQIAGYASTTSAGLGETIDISLNVSRAQGVRWDLYRIGHYQGLGARLVGSGAPRMATPQPEPSISPSTGLLECAWQVAITLTVDASWVSGYYLVKLTTDDGFESHVPFVVRESGRTAKLLMQANVSRWQAYNLWGGINLYVNHLANPRVFSGPRGYQVSFDRPYTVNPDQSSLIEHSMVRWLEQQGYDVAYVTNIDIDSNPELLQGRNLYITAGHDEYWSLAERNALEDARDQGLSMAFFSGNTAYRRIRLEPSTAGVARRVITCYKDAALDPVGGAEDNTADYHNAPHARPENGMLGVLWSGWGTLEGFPFLVSKPEHWIYEGAGLKAGESLGSIVGYEWDLVGSNGASPPGLEVVASSPALHEYGYASQHHSTVFYPTASSFVFAAGTIGWAKGLYDEGIANARVQRATENILARAGLVPESHVRKPAAPAKYESGIAARARVLAGSGERGRADGPPSKARFSYPSGIAVGLAGELYVCDTANDLLRKIDADGQVSTVLGDGGAGTIKLRTPTGVAVDGSGTVYVCDTGSSRIFCLYPDGSSHLFAGRSHDAGHVDDPDPGNARFNLPRGLAVDAGKLYVADFRNDAIRQIDLTTGAVTTIVATAGGPTAVAVGPHGKLYYLATWLGAVIEVASSGERTTLANSKHTFGDRGGPGAQAALRPADGLTLSQDGLVFTDTGNNRVRALVLDEHNTVVTLLGNGHGGSTIGKGAETCLSLPRAIATVADGYVVADTANHRILHFSNDPGASHPRRKSDND